VFRGKRESLSTAYRRELDCSDQHLIIRHRRPDIDTVAAEDAGQLVIPGGAADAGEADPIQFGQLVQPDAVGVSQSCNNFRRDEYAKRFLSDQHRVKLGAGGAFTDHVWAADSPRAANEAFNITNGDVFEWRNVWPALAKTLGVESGPDTSMSLAAYLAAHSDLWDRIVSKYGLRPLSLRQLVGHGDQHADFAFAHGAPEGPRAFVSTVKLRQAGFTETIDTQDAFRDGLQSLIDRKFLPPVAR
jgi:hypothetical protein